MVSVPAGSKKMVGQKTVETSYERPLKVILD
jgi:hypothetical protein